MKANRVLVDAIAEFGRSRGLTRAQVALGWRLARKPWIVPIPGTTKSAHLHHLIAAVAQPLTDQDVTELDRSVSGIALQGSRY